MTNLTPARVHEIVGPVWAKHPETRPDRLYFEADGGWRLDRGMRPILKLSEATLLCEAQMTRWLAEHGWDPCLRETQHGWVVTLEASLASATDDDHVGNTPVEALASACLALDTADADSRSASKERGA